MQQDHDGNIIGLTFIKTFNYQPKILEGKGDLLLLDRSVYKKVSYSNEWALYCNL